jgi:hypothetical protein
MTTSQFADAAVSPWAWRSRYRRASTRPNSIGSGSGQPAGAKGYGPAQGLDQVIGAHAAHPRAASPASQSVPRSLASASLSRISPSS